MERNFSYLLDIRQNDAQMNLRSHCVEFRQRLFWTLSVLFLFFIGCICNSSLFVILLQSLSPGIKFLQFAPGECLLTSLKICLYVGVMLVVPCVVHQTVVFISPGMAKFQQRAAIFFAFSVLVLFVSGILFGFFVLVPTAMIFFANYGLGVVEPLWSFDKYSGFIFVTLLNSGLVFQLPVFQMVFSTFHVFSSLQMILKWRWFFFLSVVASGVLTPSVDPITQILMSFVVIFLYGLGVCVVLFTEEISIVKVPRLSM
ncbi:Sec-independent translocase component C (plastid) [Cryptomonas paramecium]|uniref:Sec-independent translocase component C n=1 Tax=Cryptomonas paramaecium TaxID=2898 RepID=D2IS87_9CRYP|nr:Sec-independent translocase component C [Cryptomonas paramecium]ACT46779.1 Sec-independent translocase component C [Cryptomonas paramecium]BDA98016.1 Sec-independent translocase component C [Cryptomonas paramecium]